jgi:hypothetical protein|uniref:Hyaluronidase n=1 Tax=Siphoviridae sp. ctOkv13 TaxID=2826314 RepID=A0A8S5M2Q6_9CAUD|nr:MAG TPA: hyaluronidase [Siphoviridae sp. ctOkv13]
MADTQIKTRILLRNDVATAWTTANPVLMKGEIGIETDTNKFKIGDGVKAWSALPYVGTQVKVTGEGEVITGASVGADGTLTLTRGKLYLDDVLLEAPLTYTANIGVKTVPASGSGTIGTAGGTLLAALNEILATAKDPTVTNPSVSISLTGAGAKEVGTSFTPSYSVSFNAGSYQYGPATGITATYAVSDTASHTATAASGSFDAFTVGDTTNYKVSVTATHTEGAIPKNNLGSEVPSKKIASGTKSADSGAVTGYRNSFWGSVTSKDGTPTSAVIRGLSGKKNSAISAGYTGDASEAVGAMRVIIAVPSPRTITSIKDVNGLNAEAFSAFTHITVNVEGVNGYEAKTYNVYYKDNAAANDKANKWHFTVA